MMQIGFRGQITLELHPIEPLYILLLVGFHPNMQFAIGDMIQISSICSHVLRGFRQLDSHFGIVLRNNHIILNPALRGLDLGRSEHSQENREYDSFNQATPRIEQSAVSNQHLAISNPYRQHSDRLISRTASPPPGAQ